MTKEELVKQNNVLEQEVKEWQDDSLDQRKELTKSLNGGGLPDVTGGFYASAGKETLSWEQIFFELGKLKAKNNQGNLRKEHQALRDDFERFREEIIPKVS